MEKIAINAKTGLRPLLNRLSRDDCARIHAASLMILSRTGVRVFEPRVIEMVKKAGAFVEGAYFGDKLSPLSETTNLAPAVTGANLFDHIKNMLYTTVPSYIIAAIMFIILGFTMEPGAASIESVRNINSVLSAEFNLSPLLLLPPALVIVMVISRYRLFPASLELQ